MAYHYIEKGDVIVFDGMEIPSELVEVITRHDARLLWAFLNRDGIIQPIAFDETMVIWLTERDLQRERETTQL